MRCVFRFGLFSLLVGGAACVPSTDPLPTPEPEPAATPLSEGIDVLVTLDGEPVDGAHVMQGGSEARFTTDELGRTSVTIDSEIEGDQFILASHPEARTGFAPLATHEDGTVLSIDLLRFAAQDNEDYVFADPGTPKDRDNSSKCGHCHYGANDTWDGSAHQLSASRDTLWDTYLGRSALSTEAECLEHGGGFVDDRCILEGVLEALNPGCTTPDATDCGIDDVNAGHCADCHAPGIDGELGGRDLRAATGRALTYGIHCDVCHLVERIVPDALPGVGGALRIHRPSEPSPSMGLGPWLPLSFGPFDDVGTVKMGAVPRAHFQDGTLCAGCHQYAQPALTVELTPDAERWPTQTLPVHSTFTEWQAGPYADVAACQSCHMPPLPQYWNSADLGPESANPPGLIQGWKRAQGAMRSHRFDGPLVPEEPGFLRLSAYVTLQMSLDANELTVNVETSNVGAGHGLPTGEPGRQVLLQVSADCDGTPLLPVGGDVIGALGGSLATKTAGEDWTQWPDAEVGDTIGVIKRMVGFVDYDGYGPFALDGRFSPEEKGVRAEETRGSSTVIAISDDALGTVTLDRPLPPGDLAFLSREPMPGSAAAMAGTPGGLFARVMAGADGALAVPHFAAADVVSDRRLKPFTPILTTHRFASTCAAPTARATLLYRRAPYDEQRARGWHFPDRVFAEASR